MHADFRFSVKVPKAITHELKLSRAQALVDQFISEASGFGPKLGVVLVQLARPWSGLVNYRLYGSPRMYYSSYQPEYLKHLAQQLEAHRADGVPTFDNTAYGVATHNAFELRVTPPFSYPPPHRAPQTFAAPRGSPAR